MLVRRAVKPKPPKSKGVVGSSSKAEAAKNQRVGRSQAGCTATVRSARPFGPLGPGSDESEARRAGIGNTEPVCT